MHTSEWDGVRVEEAHGAQFVIYTATFDLPTLIYIAQGEIACIQLPPAHNKQALKILTKPSV